MKAFLPLSMVFSRTQGFLVHRLPRSAVRKVLNRIISAFLGNVALARRMGVEVGEGCRLYIRDYGSEPFLVAIGNRVTVTQGCVLLTHDGSTWLVRDGEGNRYQRYGRISIGDDVFLGVNTIVMPGVTIGSRVVVGAGSVVTKNIPDDSVCVGVPARVLGSYQDWQAKVKMSCVNENELQSGLSYISRVEMALSIMSQRAGPDLT